MSKNRVRLNIAGSEYTFLSEEEEGYVRSIGFQVDSKIREAKKVSSDISTLMAAILTSMDFCDLYGKSINNLYNLQNRTNEYLETAAKAQMETERLREENNLLKKKISTLEEKIQMKNIKKQC